MVQSGLRCPKAGLDISQTLSEGELSKCHAEILVPAGETDHLAIAIVPIDAFSKLVCGDKVHQLGKDRLPGIHAQSPHSLMRETGTSGENISNR